MRLGPTRAAREVPSLPPERPTAGPGREAASEPGRVETIQNPSRASPAEGPRSKSKRLSSGSFPRHRQLFGLLSYSPMSAEAPPTLPLTPRKSFRGRNQRAEEGQKQEVASTGRGNRETSQGGSDASRRRHAPGSRRVSLATWVLGVAGEGTGGRSCCRPCWLRDHAPWSEAGRNPTGSMVVRICSLVLLFIFF